MSGVCTLSPDEIEHYRARGYVTPDWRLPADALSELTDLVDALIAANPEVRPEQLVCPHVAGGAAGRPLAGAFHDRFLALAHQPGILAMLRQLLGPDVVLWGSQLFAKRAGDGLAIPWHQDGQYWPLKPLATCSVWIAVDPSTVENGCLRVIPGSHRDGLKRHVVVDTDGKALHQAMASDSYDTGAATDILLEPGQVSLHDVFLIHGSNPNRSGMRRAGMVYRYMPATTHFDRSAPDQEQTDGHVVKWSERPMYLVAGTDRGDNDCVVRG